MKILIKELENPLLKYEVQLKLGLECIKSVDVGPPGPHVLSRLWLRVPAKHRGLSCKEETLSEQIPTISTTFFNSYNLIMGLELFALGLVASQLTVYGLVIGGYEIKIRLLAPLVW